MDVSDLEINTLSKHIPLDRISDLGEALGFSQAQINAYKHEVTMVTRRMLCDWRDGCSRNRRQKLRATLVILQLGELVNEHLPKSGNDGTEGKKASVICQETKADVKQGRSTNVQADVHMEGCTSNDSAGAENETMDVSDLDINTLSKHIPLDRISDLGEALEFSPAQIDAFKATNELRGIVTCEGTRNMLYDWRNGCPSRIRKQKLRAALSKRNVRLGGLANEHLSKSGNDGTVGKKRRESSPKKSKQMSSKARPRTCKQTSRGCISTDSAGAENENPRAARAKRGVPLGGLANDSLPKSSNDGTGGKKKESTGKAVLRQTRQRAKNEMETIEEFQRRGRWKIPSPQIRAMKARVIKTKLDDKGSMNIALADRTGCVKSICYNKQLYHNLKGTLLIKDYYGSYVLLMNDKTTASIISPIAIPHKIRRKAKEIISNL